MDKTMAVYSFGLCGLAITSIDYGTKDSVTYYFENGSDSPKKLQHAKIYYDTERPYFRYREKCIHLDECMRV